MAFLLCISPELSKSWQQLRQPPLLQSHSHAEVQGALSCLTKPSPAVKVHSPSLSGHCPTVNALPPAWVDIHSMAGKHIHIYCFSHCRTALSFFYSISSHHIKGDSRIKEKGCGKVKKPRKVDMVYIFSYKLNCEPLCLNWPPKDFSLSLVRNWSRPSMAVLYRAC